MIDDYKFGFIIIDGKAYTQDVEARWDFEMEQNIEVLSWVREESHIIDVKDVKRAVEQKPNLIVIGTGQAGVAQVTEKAKEFIKKRGIDLVVDATGRAVGLFNEKIKENEKIIGLFHLTC